MQEIKKLLKNNKQWAEDQQTADPAFFKKLSSTHAPEFLWIGCSDARVPANQITGMPPGSIFVHRNIANLVMHTDMNLLSVVSFAVEVLKVKHIIVCGHYGCGGVAAALKRQKLGLIENWLRQIRDTYHQNAGRFKRLRSLSQKADLLVELNVKRQVMNLGNTTVIRDSWDKRKQPYIHGWVYSVHDGQLRDLGVTIRSRQHIARVFGPDK